MRIDIDFQAGAHGNYLEFICNKILGLTLGTPFNSAGASHSKSYIGEKTFVANHYSFLPTPFESSRIISIQLDVDDLLPIQQVSLLRAGDYGYDNNLLEINTYNKLNNRNYCYVLEQLMDGFFKNQIEESYNNVKDPNWPNANTKSEYLQLPQWIQDECKDVHNLVLLDINEHTPDCPRHILREFFQIGFSNPLQHGFLAKQILVNYSPDVDVFIFPFGCFYNKEKFMKQIKLIATWAGLQYNCQQEIAHLHDKFLNKQPYKHSKSKCDNIVKKIQLGQIDKLPTTDLLEEAYINAALGQNWFK